MINKTEFGKYINWHLRQSGKPSNLKNKKTTVDVPLLKDSGCKLLDFIQVT